MSTGNKNQPTGTGLGQSTPLVTISGPATISKGIAVPAGDNHPLATHPLAIPVATSTPAPPVAPPPPPQHNQNATPGMSTIAGAHMGGPLAQPPISGVSQQQPPPLHHQTLQPTIAAPPTQSQVRAASPPMSSTPVRSRVVPAAVSPAKSLDALADAFLSERSHRTDQLGLAPLLRPVPLPREDGIHRLRTLVERRAWGDVLKISTGMLSSTDDPHADVYATLVTMPLNSPRVDVSTVSAQIKQETAEIMALQCHAWLKLRRYSDLAAEVERWNFLTQNDAAAQNPDWLPWSVHILAGQTQQYSEDMGRASDILFELRDKIPAHEAVWLASVDNALANMFIRQGQWRLALGSLDRMMKLISTATAAEVGTKYSDAPNPLEVTSILEASYKCEVLSRQGRIMLQIGAVPQVATIFEVARNLWADAQSKMVPEVKDTKVVRLMPAQLEVNEGLYHFAKSNFESAMQSFSKGLDLMRKQAGDLSSKYDAEDWVGPTIAGSEAPNVLFSECVNNMSLCCLYTCRMTDAVELFEGLVREDPTAFLTERVAFNLCTLYELGADSAASARRKRVLQLVAKRFFLHDVGPESFRVT